MREKLQQLKPYPLGAHREADAIRFSFVSEKEKCGVLLYDRKTGKKLKKLPFRKEEKIGNIFCKYVKGFLADEISYQFYEEDKVVADPYARGFDKAYPYGRQREESSLRAVFAGENFEWGADRRPKVPYHESICYCMHVRGFTRHPSSGVEHKGTFRGIMEKLDYLKAAGITTVELQPAYEFLEMATKAESEKDKAAEGINYWGYKKGFYYLPKQNYAAGDDASAEFKEMVKAFHEKQMEVVMQFYFPVGMKLCRVPDILRFWVLCYHVDGFHIKGERLPVDVIAADPLLADTKIWYDSFDTDYIYPEQEQPAFKNLALYQDDYMYTMRRFLKGDENMLGGALYHMRHIPEKMGRIHYFTNYYGMTLADMVSYDYKHNEANGEDNRDGNSLNCSWNCGEEGASRRAKIRELRIKQMKNAMALLLLSQSTPLIFMGDEFGNSQRGNNNPYCQDNAITWLNWHDLEKNTSLFDFWKRLVAFRKANPIFHPEREMRIMDYLSVGYPDMSYHGQSAWKPQLESHNRHIGIMFCGKYVPGKETEDSFFYVAVNMHWEARELALPKLPRRLKWDILFDTATEAEWKKAAKSGEKEFCRKIPPRSVAVFAGVEKEALEE